MTNATKSRSRTDARPRKAGRREIESRRRQRRWIGFALGSVATIAVISTVVLSGGSDTRGTRASEPGTVSIADVTGVELGVGAVIPDFSAPELAGGTLEWKTYVGKPTVLAVWAPWCPHCQVELPRLFAAVTARPRVQMVSIATSIGAHPGPSVASYMSDNRLTFPVAIDDTDLTLMSGLGVQGFPTVYYIDASGKVAAVTEGEVADDQLTTILDELTAT